MLKNPFPLNPLRFFTLIDKMTAATNPEKSIIEFSLHAAVRDKWPYAAIIRDVQSQGKDNPKMMSDVFGQELWDEIKNFE